MRLVTSEELTDSFRLIMFWLAWSTLPCSPQRQTCPFAQGKATREAFSASLSCDLVFQKRLGIWLGIADTVSPRIKFVRLSQICLCQIWQCHLTCYSHLELLMVCYNCLNLRVGDLESTDWWMPISFLFLRQKKEKQVFPLLRRKKNWNAAFSFIPASSAFTRGKVPSSKPSPRSPIRRKQPTHLYVLDINLWGLPCFPASTLPHSPSTLPMTARVTL